MGKLHPKVAAVGVVGLIVSAIVAVCHSQFSFDPTPTEVALLTSAVTFAAGYIKRTVGTGY